MLYGIGELLHLIWVKERKFNHRSIVSEKAYAFSIRVVKLYQYLGRDPVSAVLSKQLLSSGTSIGANLQEAIGAQSPADFLAKNTIAFKEARETVYWIMLFRDCEIIPKTLSESLLTDAIELRKMLCAITKTLTAKKAAG